ncbi:MAG: hypothetical protein ACRCSF_11700 [Mycobacteriaceae bacterium]
MTGPNDPYNPLPSDPSGNPGGYNPGYQGVPPQQPFNPAPGYGAPNYGVPNYPAPGYGAPNYPAPGYGAPNYGSPAPGPFDMGQAISYGFNKFKENALFWVVSILVVAIVSIVLNALANSIDSFFISLAAGVILGVGGAIVGAAFVQAALSEVDGIKPTFASLLEVKNIGAVVVAAIVLNIATTIGFILLIIPGIIVAFLTHWTIQFVVDQNHDAITAIKSSVSIISDNVGALLPLALVLVLINLGGALLCGLGLLVTVPLTIITSSYAYRIFTGRGVPA